jgi:hypothetical protein
MSAQGFRLCIQTRLDFLDNSLDIDGCICSNLGLQRRSVEGRHPFSHGNHGLTLLMNYMSVQLTQLFTG